MKKYFLGVNVLSYFIECQTDENKFPDFVVQS